MKRFYRKATPRQREQGRAWYTHAQRVLRVLARENEVTLAVSAGVCAALSPRCRWKENIAKTAMMLATGHTYGLPLCLKKARRIIAGERPLDVLSGSKEREFYRALMGDTDAVVVDTWMLRAARFHTDKPTELQYERLADRIRRHAREFGEAPAHYQAIVWAQIRGGDA